MSSLADLETWLRHRLPAVLAEQRIPGAAVAVAAGDDVIDLAAGVLSTATGVAATPDSVFQVGSITKLWTAALVLQLADEGALEPDAPVRRYLPGFRVADEAASATVTVRQLLSHTAGFAGDVFTDTGRGEDGLRRYVDGLGDVEQVFPPGEMFSYNNAAYCVLGRIVEELRGRPFVDCLRERLIAPLGLTHTAVGAEEAILFRAAVGHLPAGDGQRPAPVWNLPAAMAPAGSLLTMRPRDLLAFARLHLDDGRAPGGEPLLRAASVRAMWETQVTLPTGAGASDAWGLGWELGHLPGGTVVGHTGGTIGQQSVLRIVPGARVAVAVVANGGTVAPAFREIVGRVLEELAGVRLPGPPVPPERPQPVDDGRYDGVYASPAGEVTVSRDDSGGIRLLTRPAGVFAEVAEPAGPQRYVRLTGETFVSARPERGEHDTVVFLGDDGRGHPQYLHGGRASRRVAR